MKIYISRVGSLNVHVCYKTKSALLRKRSMLVKVWVNTKTYVIWLFSANILQAQTYTKLQLEIVLKHGKSVW